MSNATAPWSAFSLVKMLASFGAVFGPQGTCPHRSEFRGGHGSWDGLLDYINDYGFIGGTVRPAGSSVGCGVDFLGLARLAGGLIACFLLFVFTAIWCAVFLGLALALVRLANVLGAELTFVRAFPRFDAVLFYANALCFRLATTVSLLGSRPNVSTSANQCAHP